MKKNSMKEHISDLNRNVKIKDGHIKLSTTSCEGLTYAFYLQHKNGTEKFFYSDATSTDFDIPIKPGFYQGKFFRPL